MAVAVLGAGSWGTTLGSLLAAHHDTLVWARDADVVASINERHQNPAYLPGCELCPHLRATDDLAVALDGAELVLVVVPSRFFRGVVERARPHLPPDALLVSATKGIEASTLRRMTEVMGEVLDGDPAQIGVLSGPNLAREVLAGQPSATVVACHDLRRARRVQQLVTTESLRVFTNRDVLGCEIGGAVKNVMAIAAGIADGLGYGWNTKAALMTRGLAELTRLGIALGADALTFLGLAGHGDLTATCCSPQSRNRHVGEELGKGRMLTDVLGEMTMVAEGVDTTSAVLQLAARAGIEMPIAERVGAVLSGAITPVEAVRELMQLEARSELHRTR